MNSLRPGWVPGVVHLLHARRSSPFLTCVHRAELSCRLRRNLLQTSTALPSAPSSPGLSPFTSISVDLLHLQTLSFHLIKTKGFSWVFSISAEAWKIFPYSELKHWAHCLHFLSRKLTLLCCLLLCPVSHNHCFIYLPSFLVAWIRRVNPIHLCWKSWHLKKKLYWGIVDIQ